MPRRFVPLLVIFILYAAVRAIPNLAALEQPRQRDDSAVFMDISKQPLFSTEFWGGARPPAYALFLKLADRGLYLTAALQLTFSILSWGALALVVCSFFQARGLRIFSFTWLLLLSLVPHLAGWDFSILSESLSITLFVLFTALGLWLIRDWRLWKAAALVLVALGFALIQDTNGYLLLALGFCLLVAALVGWADQRALMVGVLFAAILLFSNASTVQGGRWIQPLINIIGQRVLTVPRSVNIIQKVCKMPVSPALMGMRNEFANGQVQAFYFDPELKDFRVWLEEEGKSCYPRLLISDPVHSLRQPLEQFNELTAFRRARSFFAHDYKPLVPAALEPLLYPLGYSLAIWIVVTLAAIVALFLEAWRFNRLWAGFLLLSLTIFPHLFVVWHSEALAPERIALLVGLQLALSGWILVFLLLDFVLTSRETQ